MAGRLPAAGPALGRRDAGATLARAQEALDWQPFEEALAAAKEQQKPVLVAVEAPWCGWCRLMERETYPALRGDLEGRFVLTRLDRDDGETMHRYQGARLTSTRLAQKLGAEGVPTVALLAPSGAYLLHVSGFLTAEELRPAIIYVGSGAYRMQSFETFQAQSSR